MCLYFSGWIKSIPDNIYCYCAAAEMEAVAVCQHPVAASHLQVAVVMEAASHLQDVVVVEADDFAVAKIKNW